MYRLVLGNSIEFDHAKLMRIFNEMERAKSAYMLNSGANPALIQRAVEAASKGNDNRA